MPDPVTGSCLCGEIRWQITAEPNLRTNCHCSMCRKFHGCAYGSYLGVPGSGFQWLAGEQLIRNYESSPGNVRSFCSRCGSVVAAVMANGDAAFMPIGNMEGDIDRALDNHMFVDSKAPWFEITDDAPQFAAYPPGFDAPELTESDRDPETPGAIGGSCLCGAVCYEFDRSMEMMGFCHCSRCRKARSAPHSAQLFAAADQFRWTHGEDQMETFELPGADAFVQIFCRRCGSKMPSVDPDQGIAMIPAGSLDQDSLDRPSAHIFVASKAPWFTITDDLIQFEAMPQSG